LLETHPLLSEGTSSELGEMGFLGFAEQMTGQKPVVGAGAARTSDAPRRAGNAFLKGRRNLSQGKNTPPHIPASVLAPLSFAPTWPGSVPRQRPPAGWDLSSAPQEAAWPFNAGRKHQNHFL